MTRKNATFAAILRGLLALAMLISIGCTPAEDSSDNGKPRIFASIAPLEYFTRRIAGPHATVGVLIGSGGNPHTYSPTPKQVVKLNGADLLFCAGKGVEQVVASRLALGRTKLKVVNLADDFDEHSNHDHGHHEHGEDHHIWMSPEISSRLSERICGELVKLDPTNADEYRGNLKKLQADLNELDANIAEALAPLKGKTFFVFHPAFGHFAKRYGLVQEAVEHEGKSPGPKHRSNLVAKINAAGVKAVFVQPQFSSQAATMLAEETGCELVTLDPLAGDYINNLQHVTAELQKALKP